MLTEPNFKPRTIYRKGDRVRDDVDLDPDNASDQAPGIFEATADFISGYLPPRLVALDKPGEYWKRID